eukprot:COSAG01_NODE_74691_length_203_cov_29.557692_1_plen_30_part_01
MEQAALNPVFPEPCRSFQKLSLDLSRIPSR